MRTTFLRLLQLRPARRASALAAAAGLLLLAAEGVARATLGYSLWMRLQPRQPYDRIELVGSAASGTVLDAGGGWFNEGRTTEIVIRSEKTKRGWVQPTDIVIRNGLLRGSIRIMGMGRNGEAREIRSSSRSLGHTERAQAAAPARILLSGVTVEACGRKPLYLAPGTTGVTVEHCTFAGWSSSVAVYMDAESGRNVIRNNRFATRVGREVIAVDGSAENLIAGNRFECLPFGGIYLYRNCGEGGTVRHQTPHGNVIAGNRFSAGTLGWRAWGVWLGSRNGRRLYRESDAGYPFGSSADNRDFACGNAVTNNVFAPPCARAIRNDGDHNRIDP